MENVPSRAQLPGVLLRALSDCVHDQSQAQGDNQGSANREEELSLKYE